MAVSLAAMAAKLSGYAHLRPRSGRKVRTDEVGIRGPRRRGVGGGQDPDDPSRYDFDDRSRDSWRQVLICVPRITDCQAVFDMDGDGSSIQYISGQDDEEMVARRHEFGGISRLRRPPQRSD